MTSIPQRGQRIRLLAMTDDPDPISVGTEGTVLEVSLVGHGRDAWHQIDVAWDSGRTLMLVAPPDEFEIVS
jgi:hypothetical protein